MKSSSISDFCSGPLIIQAGKNLLSNKTTMIVVGALGLFFIGMGIYGYTVNPAMWGSYVVIGMGAAGALYGLVGLVLKSLGRCNPSESNEIEIRYKDPKKQKCLDETRRIAGQIERDPKNERLRMSSHTKELFEAKLEEIPLVKNVPHFEAKTGHQVDTDQLHNLLPVFEEIKSPLIKGFDAKNRFFIAVRFQVTSEDSQLVDGVIVFIQKYSLEKSWGMAKAYYDDEKRCIWDERELRIDISPAFSWPEEREWLKKLIDGEPCGILRYHPETVSKGHYTESNDNICRLWQPQEED